MLSAVRRKWKDDFPYLTFRSEHHKRDLDTIGHHTNAPWAQNSSPYTTMAFSKTYRPSRRKYKVSLR